MPCPANLLGSFHLRLGLDLVASRAQHVEASGVPERWVLHDAGSDPSLDATISHFSWCYCKTVNYNFAVRLRTLGFDSDAFTGHRLPSIGVERNGGTTALQQSSMIWISLYCRVATSRFCMNSRKLRKRKDAARWIHKSSTTQAKINRWHNTRTAPQYSTVVLPREFAYL